mgnify:CR=1 FL=1
MAAAAAGVVRERSGCIWPAVACLASEGWLPGVLGIVLARGERRVLLVASGGASERRAGGGGGCCQGAEARLVDTWLDGREGIDTWLDGRLSTAAPPGVAAAPQDVAAAPAVAAAAAAEALTDPDRAF